MYANVLLALVIVMLVCEKIISWCVFRLAGFCLCFLGMYVSQCRNPYKNNHFLGILSWWFSSLLHVCQCRTP